MLVVGIAGGTGSGKTTVINRILERYDKTVKTMHLQFVDPAKRYADIIVPQSGNNLVAIDILSTIIMDRLKKHNYDT